MGAKGVSSVMGIGRLSRSGEAQGRPGAVMEDWTRLQPGRVYAAVGWGVNRALPARPLGPLLDQPPQGFVHGGGIREDLGNVRVQDDQRAPFREPAGIFTHYPVAEVVLIPHFGILLFLTGLAHISSVPGGSPRAR